jgi:hypothetical protein
MLSRAQERTTAAIGMRGIVKIAELAVGATKLLE